jgi:hypothetical protein
MILAEKPTAPKYSIGKAKRIPLYTFTNTPGPIYSQNKYSNLKYDRPPEWKIGDSLRPPLYNGEIYEMYKHKYDESSDLSKIPKKWNHIKGGAIDLEPRVRYDFNEKVPGPGRYDPDWERRSQCLRMPTYKLGIRTNNNSIIIPTGSGRNVGPSSYNQDNLNALSQYVKVPGYSFKKGKREDLNNKIFTKNESYYIYSSIGHQIMTQKPTEPIQSIGKETRDGRLGRGIFKSMMERQPQQIRIAMPKF